MNALFDQFVIETRELLEQAAAGLLALEKTPRDDAALNQVFRAFHSMKGGAALFGFDAMTGLMHAGEDLLAAAREAALVLDSVQVDLLLAALDQVERWVDAGERQQALPAGESGAAAELTAQLREGLRQDKAGEPAPRAAMSLDWLVRLPAASLRAARAHGRPLLAVRYLPDVGCFYSGEDPFSLVRQLPDRYGMLVEPADPWPGLEALDPYRCVLQFYVLTGADRAEAEQLFHYLEDEVSICDVPLTALAAVDMDHDDAGQVGEAAGRQQFRRVLSVQRQVLEMPAPPEEVPGRVRAVVTVLRNALHAIGQVQDIAALEQALAEAERMQDPQPLLHCLAALQASGPAADRTPEPPVATAAPGQPLQEERRALPSLRVNADKIDRLIELAGELVVARNRLPVLARRAEQVYGQPVLAREILAQSQAIDRMLREMQRAVMEVRMLPVAHLFAPLSRQVRDLARQLGKEVRLEVQGEDTEADKNLIEAMAEPLLHLIRNSIDHGIEPAAERLAAGKPGAGHVRVAAYHDGDSIIIEVADDGRGIDPDAVRQRALQHSGADPARLAAMDDRQLLQLVFMPGFSTAASVSEVSGRGVGMDVVHHRVERAGGQIELESAPGAGTQVRLRLPLQMALSRVLVVDCSGQVLGIPLAMVRETLRLRAEAVQTIKSHQAFTLRDQVLPLVSLRRLLDLPGTRSVADLAVVVINARQGAVGIIVDDFQGEQEVLQKPLQDFLGGVPGYSGSAVLGDGSILLVLDIQELL